MFKKLATTTLLATAVLSSGTIANATSPSVSNNVSPLANNLSTLSTNSNGQFTTLASSVYYLAETRLESNGSKNDYYKSSKFTIKNSTGTTYKGWQVSERNNAIAHVLYKLIDPSTGDTVSSSNYYGDVKKDDGRYWLEITFNNVSTTKDYQLEVQNLGKYPVKLSGNVYN
ncbi:hypothetical protein C883_3380 [Bacillus stratosphericus LAMA 585]|nr:hypothetical protein C883_3380 [Bacillus stratosphericus LAMA 585]